MGQRRQQQELLYLCYAAAVVWCATVAQTSASPRPNPAEQQSNEDDAHGLPDVSDIAHTPEDDVYYDYEDALKYDETAADDESDYYASIAAELTTALPSQQSVWPLPGDDPLSYSEDYMEDETSSDEAVAVGEGGNIKSDGALEGRRPNACQDVAALFGASDEGCKDVETEPYDTESDEESSQDYPYSY